MLQIHDQLVGGLRTAIHDSQTGQSPATEAVVFVHGNPGPMDDYVPLIEQIRPFARTVAMDLPGFGRSEHPSQFDFSVGGYARFLGQALEQLQVERAHLVLHDFGGPFGLQWAVNHPRKVASVTLINTGVLREYRWHYLARIWQTPVLGELFQLLANRRMMEIALKRDNPQPVPAEFVARIDQYADWANRQAVLKLYRATRDPQLLEAQIPILRDLDLPACVVWGAEDPYLSVALAESQREAFPRAEVHILSGLGHWPFMDDPQRVNQIVVPFLQQQLCAPSAQTAT